MSVALIVPILAGLAGGVLVNFLADTLPRTRRLSRPSCVQCGSTYPAGIYLAAMACRVCGHKRGVRPWIVLAAMVALALFIWLTPHSMGFLAGILVLVYFVVVVVIDIEHRLILQPISLVGGLLALVVGMLLHGVIWTMVGGLAGFAIMSVLYYLGIVFSRIRAQRLAKAGQSADSEDALGQGDVILATVLGLLLGWPLIWFGLLMGILIGGVIGLVILLVALVRGRYGRQAFMQFMPYGPSFVISAFLILFLPKLVQGMLPR